MFLRSQRLANRFATFLAMLPSFLRAPTNGFCLPLSGQFSLFCVKNLEDPAASSFCMRQDFPETYLCFFLTHQQFQRPNHHFHIVASFQVIFHCRYYSSFVNAPDAPLSFQHLLSLTFVRRRKRHLLWRRRRHPSSGIRRALLLRPFATRLSLILFQLTRTLDGERKGLRFNKLPIRIQGNIFTRLSHRRGRGHTRISNHRQTRPRPRITVRQTTRIIPKITPGITTTLRNLTLTKISKASVETTD